MMKNKSNLPFPCTLIQISFLWCKNEISCCIFDEGNKLHGGVDPDGDCQLHVMIALHGENKAQLRDDSGSLTKYL